MKEHHLCVQRSARIFTLGGEDDEINEVWIACHGYGQAANRFINKFDQIASPRCLVVVPEGLSRFYFGGFTGVVGASWMTKEHREAEITDYLDYLDAVFTEFVPAKAKVILFGFSQGCATITRWACLRNPNYDSLILWSGTFPHDLNYEQFAPLLNAKNLILALGTKDQFLNEAAIAKQKLFRREKGLDARLHIFEGPHEVIRTELNLVRQML